MTIPEVKIAQETAILAFGIALKEENIGWEEQDKMISRVKKILGI